MLQRALSVFGVGETVPVEQRTAIAVLAGILLLIGANPAGTELDRKRAERLFLLALYLAVPLLATWISALQRPIFNERYLIAAVPPFFLLLAVAVLGWGREITGRRLVMIDVQALGAQSWMKTAGLGRRPARAMMRPARAAISSH